MKLKTLLLAVFLMTSFGAQAESGSVSWGGWRFDYTSDSGAAGLMLNNVYYNDRQILYRASFPVMRVQYRNDVCGPYADILWSDTYIPLSAPQSGCDGDRLCRRTFTQNGQQWLELGVNSQIGEYQIYQSYFFSPDGFFDALVFSRGLQCVVDHNHHAHWLFDFDIDGYPNDQVLRNTSDLQVAEFNDRRTDSAFWSVQDNETGLRVEISPGRDDGFVDDFSQWDVAARVYKGNETGNWLWGPRGEIGSLFNESENIDGRDIVFWYVTHLEHSALEGEDLWHYSGPRIRVVNP